MIEKISSILSLVGFAYMQVDTWRIWKGTQLGFIWSICELTFENKWYILQNPHLSLIRVLNVWLTWSKCKSLTCPGYQLLSFPLDFWVTEMRCMVLVIGLKFKIWKQRHFFCTFSSELMCKYSLFLFASHYSLFYFYDTL